MRPRAVRSSSTSTLMGSGGGVSCFSRAGPIVDHAPGIDVVARDRKVCGERMLPGARIWSPNAEYELWMQETDGNLVLYGPEGAEWASGTNTGDPLWATSTFTGGNEIIVQNDGHLVVYDPNEHPGWACCS